MTPASLVAHRLRAMCVSPPARTAAEDVVARLGAVQAQDYLGALWGVGLRVAGAREEDVERALAERKIVRTWTMRGTLHFVSAADVRWMTALLTRRPVAAAASRLRSFGIDKELLARARRALERELDGGRSITRPAAYAALERAKITTSDGRGLLVLWRLAHDALLCFGARAGKQQTLALLDEWVPATRPLARDEALEALAHRYFTGHGPATVPDFAWWSGLTLTDARRAVHLAEGRLAPEDVRGTRYWSARDDAPAGAPRHGVHVLPAFDELLVGYADRSASIASSDARRVIGGGIFNPVIVAGGRVAGTWRRRIEGGKVCFETTTFAPLSERSNEAVARAFERYARFLSRAVGRVANTRA